MPLYILVIQSAILLAVSFYGLTTPATSIVRMYFFCEGIYTIATFGTRVHFGLDSKIFPWVYGIATLAMIWCALLIVMQFCSAHHDDHLSFALGLSVLALMLLANHFQPPRSPAGWINMLEGTVLMACGATMGTSAPLFTRNTQSTGYALALMWIALGVFRQTYRLHWGQPEWETANDYFPWLATAIGMSYVAWSSRSSRPSQAGSMLVHHNFASQ
jgi:hypothetical protein